MTDKISFNCSLQPGLYLTAGMDVIFICSRQEETKNAEGQILKVTYIYYVFNDGKFYEFNNYWDGFINGLIPITDPKALEHAEEVIEKQFKKQSAKSDELNETLGALVGLRVKND